MIFQIEYISSQRESVVRIRWSDGPLLYFKEKGGKIGKGKLCGEIEINNCER